MAYIEVALSGIAHRMEPKSEAQSSFFGFKVCSSTGVARGGSFDLSMLLLMRNQIPLARRRQMVFAIQFFDGVIFMRRRAVG